MKLRIYPNKEQKDVLNNWFGASRVIYNRCLSYVKEEYKKDKEKRPKDILKAKNLRARFINNVNYEKIDKWMLDIPYDIRDESMRDLVKNYSSNMSKGDSFDIQFKSRKKSLDSINVLGKYWNTSRGMYSSTFTSEMKCEMKLPETLDHTCRIIRNKLNKYYIFIPKLLKKETKIKNEKLCKKSFKSEYESQINGLKDSKIPGVLSIDPGVRTFLTCYDPSGLIMKFGEGFKGIGKLSILLKYKDKLQSLISKTRKRFKRNRLNKAFLRSSEKITNVVQDCHKKLSKWFCQNYKTILIPKLNFQGTKNISKNNRRKLLSWSHCSFVDRLIHKSREYNNCKVIQVTEEYTSKTCGCCGFLKQDLGSSKTFKCNKCLTIIDRDINGARNILLKYITK